MLTFGEELEVGWLGRPGAVRRSSGGWSLISSLVQVEDLVGDMAIICKSGTQTGWYVPPDIEPGTKVFFSGRGKC